MDYFSLVNILSWLLGLFFFVGAIINSLAPGKIREDYHRWGYPAWFRFITALLELIAAILIVSYRYKLPGLALAVLVMGAAIITLIYHKEFKHAIPAGVVAFLCLVLIFTLQLQS